MLKRSAGALSVLAGAGVSAAFAHTGPGAVLHAAATGTATVGTFVGCYALAAFPAEVRARRAARRARAIDVAVLEPAGMMSVDQVREHWQEPTGCSCDRGWLGGGALVSDHATDCALRVRT